MSRVTIGAARAYRPESRWSFRESWKQVRAFLELRRTRMALLQLDDQQLRDVGITRGMAREEARRSFLTDD